MLEDKNWDVNAAVDLALAQQDSAATAAELQISPSLSWTGSPPSPALSASASPHLVVGSSMSPIRPNATSPLPLDKSLLHCFTNPQKEVRTPAGITAGQELEKYLMGAYQRDASSHAAVKWIRSQPGVGISGSGPSQVWELVPLLDRRAAFKGAC